MSPSFSALILHFFSIFPVLCWSRSCAPVCPCCAARNANVALSARCWISAELCPGTDLFSPVSDFYRCSVFGPCTQAVRHQVFLSLILLVLPKHAATDFHPRVWPRLRKLFSLFGGRVTGMPGSISRQFGLVAVVCHRCLVLCLWPQGFGFADSLSLFKFVCVVIWITVG
jgi:hypothetical protein